MADGDSVVQEAREKVRAQLRADNVKLWLPPFTHADGVRKGCEPQELTSVYAETLSMPAELVSRILEELREYSCIKLLEKKQNCANGIATLRIKLAGNTSDGAEKTNNVTVDICLTVRGQDLKHAISEKCSVPPNLLKLIVSGHVIKDDLSLEQQDVKNGSQVMVLRLSANDLAAIAQDDLQSNLSITRQAAEWLTVDDADDDRYNLEITNQNGVKLKLPAAERKALTIAMMLHERGRAALKKKDYGVALVYFLDADSHFKSCGSSLLNSVDNFAVLSLDIVWCYLCLQNLESLPDAVDRLKMCEEGFRRSYGTNVERLQIVKGGVGKEKALFMRLHLLQGILAFHQRRKEDAKRLLKRAEDELVLLKVDEEAMTQVMEVGFTSLEARLALRSNVGDVHGAIAEIVSEREQQKKKNKLEQEERKNLRTQRKLGMTANGQKVNMHLYESLLGMGFPKGGACESLRQSNNDITAALEMLQNHRDILAMPDPDPRPTRVTKEIIAQLVSMGFDPHSAKAALHFFGSNVEKAVDELMLCGGVAAQEWLVALQASTLNRGAGTSRATAREGSRSSASPVSSGSDPEEGGDKTSPTVEISQADRDQAERDRIIHEEIVPDIPTHDEDYLDLALDEEEGLLLEYQALLTSLDQA